MTAPRELVRRAIGPVVDTLPPYEVGKLYRYVVLLLLSVPARNEVRQ